ncbi:MAG: hypothetical protein QGI68_10675 [Pseudomonadales bacterium]|jgi:CubicO group peptidase (beta-lactamase class C family)|nr:hypothetical protein [Pseudomonadales bacterium]MDP7358554.1 hypothetical protein [Pseudomonadales bacterium]MDP7596015.1 hypothetical protein [Pseudomonadales bacterium]HJN53065.1 hypothetical protein [Pseudomonadales bacterium]|tara:strand:+ start:567 stop:965 length:399 start_codon:yes stop_codon:yes gene_type:complete
MGNPSSNDRRKTSRLDLLATLTIVAFATGSMATDDRSAEHQSIDQKALTALLEDAREEMKMPGLRASVRLADGRIVRAAVGLADVEANIPLNDTVGMPGGSTGKASYSKTSRHTRRGKAMATRMRGTWSWGG